MKPQNIKEFRGMYPGGFESISVDVVGFCNAKCKYCPSGNDLSNVGSYMSPELYEQVIVKLSEYGFYSENTNFHIYGSGEPCLHPNLNEILNLTNKHGMKTVISTNASILPEIEEEGLACVTRVLISMPGFSQQSYDKIHGFDFEKVKKNILSLKKIFHGIPFDMSYHIYQFNLDEIEMARMFCKQNDIRFALNYAVLMDKNKCTDYVTGDMSYEELKDISKEIFLGILDEQIASSSRDYCDVQERFLSVTEKGDVKLCTGFSKSYEPNILCGNITTECIDDIIYSKYNHKVCSKCIGNGLTQNKGYDCKVYPNYYYSIMKENEFICDWFSLPRAAKSLSNQLTFMHEVRNWEQDHYSDMALNGVLHMIQENQLSAKEVEMITVEYSRFGTNTWKCLKKYLTEEI